VKQDLGTVAIEANVENVQHFAVQTRYLAAVVKGTRFTVTVGKSGAKVDVRRGHVEIDDPTNQTHTTISVGQSASVDKTATAGTIEVSGSGNLPVVLDKRGEPVSALTPKELAKAADQAAKNALKAAEDADKAAGDLGTKAAKDAAKEADKEAKDAAKAADKADKAENDSSGGGKDGKGGSDNGNSGNSGSSGNGGNAGNGGSGDGGGNGNGGGGNNGNSGDNGNGKGKRGKSD